MKPKKNLTNASKILDSILSGKNLKKKIDDYKSLEVWDDVVGDMISLNAQPLTIKKGLLKVVVSNHGWLQQLQFLKEDIRKKLNHELQKETINEIYFIVGEVRKKDEKPVRVADEMKKITLSADERKSINNMLLDIEDTGLKRALRKTLTNKLKRNKLNKLG